jgi:2-polyprenyl-3-methyl-5-hydroxy-6-metoxy-1,4-benzoquinol methylase
MTNAEKFWDRAAGSYDREEQGDAPTYARVVEETKKYLEAGDLVLDFGCGTGRISNEIAGTVRAVHALDISSKMIEIARQKAEQRNIGNIVYAHSTILDERYQKSSYDAVLAFYILHLVEDAPRVMQRIHELLKPGGLLISATPCLGEKGFLRALLSLSSKVGLTPKIRAFTSAELKETIARGNFDIAAADCLEQNTGQYFIAAMAK